MEIFGDGFDNYSVLTDFYDYAGVDSAIHLTGGSARTGRGWLQINSAAFGPYKVIPHNTSPLFAINWQSDTPGFCMGFMNFDADVGENATLLKLLVLSDGNVAVNSGTYGGPQPLLGRTFTPGLVTFNIYNSLAMQATIGLHGTVNVWVNGVQVLALTNVDTRHMNNPALNYINAVQIMGPGGIPTCLVDDVYCLDCSVGPNSTFLGALRLYAMPPTANASVQWTPLSGTNWSEVSEVPPDGDTSYNSSGTVGQIDQYVYPLAGVPAGASIKFVQHELDMRVDSGSRSVASVAGGVIAATSQALGNGYHIYPTAYDLNPVTGLPWAAGDFPFNFGPGVTA